MPKNTPQYITIWAYSEKHSIPYSTLKDWARAGKIKDIKRETKEIILINKDYKIK